MNSNSILTLTGERVWLRPLSLDDAPALHSMYSDAQTMRFMPSLPHKTVRETKNHIQYEVSNSGAVCWAICLAGSDEPIGVVNYLGGTPIPGMGYVIKRPYWGQGYTVEACRLALQYGFEQMKLKQVELWIDQQNVQSQRVAQKLGFQQKGQLAQKYAHEANHHIMFTYGLWRDQFFGRGSDLTQPRVFKAQSVLMVHDVGKTAVYYRDKLGFRIDFLYGHPPRHAGVSLGNWTGQGVTIQFSKVPASQELGVSTYLYLFMDAKIDLLYEKFLANGVECVSPPESYPWGMREFKIRDLNGHLLVFATQV